MAVRHRRGAMVLAAALVLTGAGVAVVRDGPAVAEPQAQEPAHEATVTATAKPQTTKTKAKAAADARTQIRANGAALRSAPGEEYHPTSTVTDDDGAQHVRFQRTHQGRPVLGGDVVVHSGATGSFAGATVAQQQAIDVPATAKVSRARALKAAGQPRGSARQVVDAIDGEPALAWEVTGGGKVTVIDAGTGAIRRGWDLLETAESGTGHGLQVGDVALSTMRRADGTYTLVDPDRGGNTVRDALNQRYTSKPGTFAEFTDEDNAWGDGSGADRATGAVDVYYGMTRTADYLRETFGRDGLFADGKGVTAYVHHEVDQANAAWNTNCKCMMFGDGAPPGKPFTTLDVVAHEMAHGLTRATADLVYSGESGGLNESSSDIFGTLVEFAVNSPADPPDYLVGEKTETRAPALRVMDEPSRDGESASCWSPTVKDLDVHNSSGIGNKFFYTLAVGSGVSSWGDSPPCGDAAPVTGLGNDRAAQIWYRALTVYMVSNTNYAGAREATLLAAADLYGPDSIERRTVDAAWAAAGVDGSGAVSGSAPQIAPFADSMPGPRVGHAVQLRASAREPQGQPVTFSADVLPPGLTISPDGLISGTPTTRGEYIGYVIATDPDGNADRELLFWVVKGPPVLKQRIGTGNLQLGVKGFYSVLFEDAPDYRKDPEKSVTVTAEGLPDGLTLRLLSGNWGAATAIVDGIPTTAGSGTTVVTATDIDGDQTTVSVPWTVTPAQVPAVPAAVRVTPGSGTALVAWDKPSSGALPTGYVVRVSPGATTTLDAGARSLRVTGLDVLRSYTIGIRATSAAGDGIEHVSTLTPAGVPLTVSPPTVSHGKAAVLTGKVLRSGTAATAGATLTLEQRPAGRTTWSLVATVKTDVKGVWRSTVKPATTTAYRVRFTGLAGMWPATSATRTLTVRHTVTIKASTTKPRANKKIKIYGTAKPARAGVKITLQRRSGSRWVTVTSVKTAASGAYTFSRAFKRGTWTLRVVAGGSASNASATSSAITLKVK
ncbi:M4 family metallopeptidase [Actinoplanes palleronii]|nr:M4 family metallopeptidase [Actinoplanes palleronii]